METRRTDLPANATPHEIYQWSLVRDEELTRLNFVSMSLNPQQRIFEEGAIRFDLKSCEGVLLGQKIELLRQDSVSEKLEALLSASLKEKGP